MTVAIGLVCNDGVLVASDSMGSDLQTASKVTKVFKLDCCPIVWTAAGSVYVIEEVKQALAGIDQPNTQTGGPPIVFAKPDPVGLRSKLKGTILKTMQTCYSGALASTPFAQGATAPSFIAEFLVCGYANSTPWLLEFSGDGQVNWHTDAGFYALGSGGPFATVAHGLMAHYLATPLSVEQGMKVAYRAIETTYEVSHSGVGPPVQIAVVDNAGARIIDKEEVDAVGEQVARWKTLEVESLNMTSEDAQATAEGDLPSIANDQAAV